MQHATQPSTNQLAALLLTLAADALREHETITHSLGGQVARCITAGYVDQAFRTAIGPVFEQVRGFRRYATQIAIEEAARAALPPLAGTVADYADRLRETATAYRLAV
jgi:hypothetical protein